MPTLGRTQTGTGLGVDFTMTITIEAKSVVFVMSHTSNNTVTTPTSPNLTFTQIGSAVSYAGNGQHQVFRAQTSTLLVAEVITMNTGGSGPQVTGAVISITGSDLSGTNGSAAVGANTTFSSGGATANTASVTTTRNRSLVLGFFAQTSNTTMTAPAGQTAVVSTAQGFSRSSIGRQNAMSGPQAVVTMLETMGGSVPCGCTVIEVLAPGEPGVRSNSTRPAQFKPGLAR